jgi:6-phosphogluconate dehydrogenase (decarboxylating)
MMAAQAAAVIFRPRSMPIEVIGLGRMGGNIVIVRRLIAHRHDAVICDRDHKAVATLSGDGAAGAAGLEELVHRRLGPPRTVWLMLPTGAFNARFRSRRERTSAEKVLSAMRKGVGGQVEPGTARP